MLIDLSTEVIKFSCSAKIKPLFSVIKHFDIYYKQSKWNTLLHSRILIAKHFTWSQLNTLFLHEIFQFVKSNERNVIIQLLLKFFDTNRCPNLSWYNICGGKLCQFIEVQRNIIFHNCWSALGTWLSLFFSVSFERWRWSKSNSHLVCFENLVQKKLALI